MEGTEVWSRRLWLSSTPRGLCWPTKWFQQTDLFYCIHINSHPLNNTDGNIYRNISPLQQKSLGFHLIFAQIIQKFFKKCISGRKRCQQVTNEIFSTFQSRIFSLKTQRYFLEEDKKNVIRPSSPRPDDRSKLSVGLGLPLKNYPNFIKLGFSWNVSSFQFPPQAMTSQRLSWRQTLHNTKFGDYQEVELSYFE